jgi:hypothetical protein
MSCYFRHMKDIFTEAGIEITPANKREIDRAIHRIVGIAYKDCSATWKRLKHEFVSDEGKRRELARRLKQAVK